MTDAEGKTVIRPETIDYWNYLSACYWAMDAGMMSDMARATGRDASKYEAMQQKATDYIRATFTNTDGTFKNDILTTTPTAPCANGYGKRQQALPPTRHSPDSNTSLCAPFRTSVSAS